MATKPQEAGVTRLNSALLSSDPTTATNLRAAGQRATDLTGAVAGAEEDVAAQAQQAAIKNAETKRQALAGVGSYLTQSDTDIDQRLANVKAAQTAKDNAAKAYLQSLATGEVSADGAAAVGLTPEQATALQTAAASGNPTARANLASYYTPAAVDTLTRNNVITPEEAARLTALANIAGRSGYTAAPTTLSSSFNLYGAQNALRTGVGAGTTPGTTTPGTTTPGTTAPGTGVGSTRPPVAGTGSNEGPPGNDGYQTGGTGTGGIGLGGFGLGGISINDQGIAVANTTGLNDKTASAIGNVLGSLLGLPGLGMIGSKVNASLNSSAEAAAKGANIGMQDSNTNFNGSMNTPGSAATSGPTGTGGISANAGEAAAAAAAQAGFSDAAIGAAAQAAADAARGGASADAAAAAGRAAADAAAIEGGALNSGSDAAALDAHDAEGLAAADAASAALDAGAPSGGGGGGDKIICTAMNDYYGLPYRENKVWLLYSNKRLTPAHQRGYHKVFLPLVQYGYHSARPGHNLVRKGLEWMARTRTKDLEAELNNTNPRPVIRAIRKTAEALLQVIGTKKD